MKTFKIVLLLIVLFCVGNHIYAQPGEESDKKYNVHEIKLYEREDGSKAGAMAWSTAAPDSVQKFVIRNLSIMEPVQVLLKSLSPNDEVTMQFVKEKWSQPESSISAKGKTNGEKIFRTYKTAAMAIKAKKAGVPYMIVIQVGKEFPMNATPIFKITNDKDEYENLLRGKGLVAESNQDIGSNSGSKNGNGEEDVKDSSSLLYVIIGLLVIMVAFLAYFVFVRKGSKKILLFPLLFALGLSSLWGQSATDPNPIDIGALVVSRQEFNAFVQMMNNFKTGTTMVQSGLEGMIQSNTERDNEVYQQFFEFMARQERINGDLAALQNEFNQFKNDFVDGMPGEGGNGGPRSIPPGISQEELNRIRSKIRNLESQVSYLSERDRNYAPPEDNEEQIPVFCESIEACLDCVLKRSDDVNVLFEKFRDLNSIMAYNDWLLESGINEGNNLANMVPSFALGWQSQHLRLLKTRKDIWIAYHDKYGELLERVERIEQNRETCLKMFETDGFAVNWKEMTKDIIRDQTPELVTPMF